jgi:hypothetical protein
MKRRKLWSEPEVTPEVTESIRWYLKLDKWRYDPNGQATLEPLRFADLIEYRRVYDSWLDNEYLFELIHAIDSEYLKQLAMRRKSA